MESYHDPDGWEPMEQGPGGSVWRPRATAQEAVAKCLEWAGIGDGRTIPTMQVRDLDSGQVVWGAASYDEPGAGDPVEPAGIVTAARLF